MLYYERKMTMQIPIRGMWKVNRTPQFFNGTKKPKTDRTKSQCLCGFLGIFKGVKIQKADPSISGGVV